MGPGFGQDPNSGSQTPGQMDDVKQAIVMLMEQQQANEPHPRPPTDAEAAQIRQKAMEMIQAKKAGGGAGQQPPMDFQKTSGDVVGGGAPPPPPGMGGGGPPPPPQGAPSQPPPGPADVPPATGKSSAKDAMDLMLMQAKSNSPQSKDVKAPPQYPVNQEALARERQKNEDFLKTLSPQERNQAMMGLGPAGVGGQQPPPQDPSIQEVLDQARKIQDHGAFDASGQRGNPKYVPQSSLFSPSGVTGAMGGKLQFEDPEAQFMVPGKGLMGPEKGQATQTPPQAPASSNDAAGEPSIDDVLEQARSINSGGEPHPEGLFPAEKTPVDSQEHGSIEEHSSKVASAIVNSGVDSPEKAKVWLGNNAPESKEVMDDPQLKEQLAKYEQEYNDAKARTDDTAPSVAQYIAAVLMALAGHPELAQNVLQMGRGKAQQRENLAGEQLMKARLHGMATRSQALQQAKIDATSKAADNREEGMNRRADQHLNYQRLKDGRDSELKVALKHLTAGEQEITQKGKVAAAMKAAESIRRVNEFNIKLGEPPMTEKYLQSLMPQAPPKPQGMMGQPQQPQPDQGMQQNAMRLIGLGA